MYSFCINFELLQKKTKSIAMITVIAAISNVFLNYFFIPLYGGIAAAFTTLTSYTISFCLHYFHCKKMNNSIFPFQIFIPPIFILLSASLSFYIWRDYLFIRWGIAIVLDAGILLYLYKRKKNNEPTI